ncbi:ankyrin repeat domain-containing protein 39-like [Saccostrea cucullata]|uniref:ankyrin repeat domain-containing protein 39-like n=1 Tax=Saccostrea cuccullata TaxID=36930 RepID=UPI002ED6315C
MNNFSSGHAHNCGAHSSGAPSVHQTLDEMEFERGIWSAALNGDYVEVQKHLEKGENANVTDSSGYTALHYASRNNHLNICELLLKSGADVNCVTKSGVTPLHRAAYRGNLEILQLLLKRGASPTLQDCDGKTALHKAVEMEKTDAVDVLVKQFPDSVSIVDNKGQAPISYVKDPSSPLYSKLMHQNPG